MRPSNRSGPTLDTCDSTDRSGAETPTICSNREACRLTASARARSGMTRAEPQRCSGDAVRLGISRKTFYAVRDTDVLEQLSRGLFPLRDMPPLTLRARQRSPE